MTDWQLRPVSFRYQLSDLTLFSVDLPLQARAGRPPIGMPPVAHLSVPDADLAAGSQGFCIRNLPVMEVQPVLSEVGAYYCYVPLQYTHCYIDLDWSFEQYVGKFSAKTRSTILRKIRKFKDHCGGELRWSAYVTPEELEEFFRLARPLSKLTYQERLLDVGLPDNEGFRQGASSLAAAGQVRAYILFDGEQPVSYLYCPAREGVLTYAFLGYDPEYKSWSVGTVLQWLAIESIFAERKFRYFDFTEGQSSHKELFASHQCKCANVFFVRRSLFNGLIIRAHVLTNRFSKGLGELLERHGLKAKVRRLLRRM